MSEPQLVNIYRIGLLPGEAERYKQYADKNSSNGLQVNAENLLKERSKFYLGTAITVISGIGTLIYYSQSKERNLCAAFTLFSGLATAHKGKELYDLSVMAARHFYGNGT